MKAWFSIPPTIPECLHIFLGKITRNLSFDKYRAGHSAKRGGGEIDLVLEELEEVVAGSSSVEALRDNYCYDNMPGLGTNLKYKQLTASIVESGNIRIESQNYGFDLGCGIRQVELEPDAERYYMIVKILK